MAETCNREEIERECNCTYPNCPRKGKCCECIKYHRSMGQFPACFFTPEGEKTYDRSWSALKKYHI